jgi:hypothetical protein
MAQSVKQSIYLPALDKDATKACLTLNTHTSNRCGLTSYAQVGFESADGCVSFLLFGDFNKRVLTTPSVRGTQKAIDTHHRTAFTPEAIEALKAEAVSFYAAQAAKAA